MRCRPANIRVIDRRDSRLDRLRCCFSKSFEDHADLTGRSISDGVFERRNNFFDVLRQLATTLD